MRPFLLDTIRDRFQRTCGYCGVNEVAAGGELTLDHHRPQSACGADALDNLVYACVRCNQYKGDFWPTEDDLAQGRRVLHPLLDDMPAHLVAGEDTGLLHGLTPTGIFHITLLRLNRPQLVAHRLARRLQAILHEKIRLLEQQNVELQGTISAQERYLASLRAHASIGGLSSER